MRWNGTRASVNDMTISASGLPAQIRELLDLKGTEDGLIVKVSKDTAGQNLRIVLRCGYVQIGCYDLELAYSGAQVAAEDEAILFDLAVTTVDVRNHKADFCRHDVNMVSGNLIEHRLEFYRVDEPNVCVSIRSRDLR